MGPASNRDKADNRLAGRDNKAGGIGRNRRDSGADSGAARSSLSLLSTRQSPVRRLSARPRRQDQLPAVRPAPSLPQRPLLSISSSQAPPNPRTPAAEFFSAR